MVLTKATTTTFHRTLYAGELQTITLLKREDDQRQGVVRSLLVFESRRGNITHVGEPIQGSMAAGDRCMWYIPNTEMARVGVDHLNAIDRIVDEKGRYWQPEAQDPISLHQWENHYSISCQRVDPPRS